MPEGIPAGLVVWAAEESDADSQKLALRLGVPLVISDEPPGPDKAEWLLFHEEDVLFLHNFAHEFKPLAIDYLEKEFQKRWRSLGGSDLLVKAIGVKKGVRTVCDLTCGLGYDAFLLATLDTLEVTTCERNPVVAELVMNALLRVKEMGRFEDFPLYFYFGNSAEFLRRAGEKAFDCVYLDPMYPREADKSAKQKKEMQLLRDLVGKDEDAESLFALAWASAKKRVVVKRPDDAESLVKSRKADATIDGKTVRYDLYLKG